MKELTSSKAVDSKLVIPNSSQSSHDSIVTEDDPSDREGVDINDHNASSEHNNVNYGDALDMAASTETGAESTSEKNSGDVLMSVSNNKGSHEPTQSKTEYGAAGPACEKELDPLPEVLSSRMTRDSPGEITYKDRDKVMGPAIAGHSMSEALPCSKADSPQIRESDGRTAIEALLPASGDDPVHQAAPKERVEQSTGMSADVLSHSKAPYLPPADMALDEPISDKDAADKTTSDPASSAEAANAIVFKSEENVEDGHATDSKKRTRDSSPLPTLSDPPLTPAEEKRIEALNARTATLEQTLADLTTQRSSLLSTLSHLPSIRARLPPTTTSDPTSSADSASSEAEPSDEAVLAAAKAIIKRHITLLHDYNEIRDVGQGLMGMIADSRAVRIRDVQEEFGVDPKD